MFAKLSTLAELQGVKDAIDAYKAFGERRLGLVKVEL